jgi:hypothetical protein
MAGYDTDPNDGMIDKRKVGRITAVSNAPDMAEIANHNSVSLMRTRLAGINVPAGYWTAARLNQMSKNDMEYAVRVVSADVAGI